MRFKIFFLISALIVFFPLSALSQLPDFSGPDSNLEGGNLRDVALRGADLRGMDFSNWNLSGRT